MKNKKLIPQKPTQKQKPPGIQKKMYPQPQIERKSEGAHKLQGKVAVITGGDSGIGQAVAAAFAKKGADIAIIYLKEHTDANKTKQLVEKRDKKCLFSKSRFFVYNRSSASSEWGRNYKHIREIFMGKKYGESSQKSVKRAMHKMKAGTLKSGKSNKIVKSRKQAIAIGLSEARKKGAKVPKKIK